MSASKFQKVMTMDINSLNLPNVLYNTIKMNITLNFYK